MIENIHDVAEEQFIPETERAEKIRVSLAEGKQNTGRKIDSDILTLQRSIEQKRRSIEDLERKIEAQRAAVEKKTKQIEELEEQQQEYFELAERIEEQYTAFRKAETAFALNFKEMAERWDDALLATPSLRRSPEYVRDRAVQDNIGRAREEFYDAAHALYYGKRK